MSMWPNFKVEEKEMNNGNLQNWGENCFFTIQNYTFYFEKLFFFYKYRGIISITCNVCILKLRQRVTESPSR